MKFKKVCATFITAVAILSLVGCTVKKVNNDDESTPQTESPSSSECSEKATESKQSISQADSEKVNDNSTIQDSEAKATAKKLFDELNVIDSMGASGLEMDTDNPITINGQSYAKVTDKRFKSTKDVKKYMENALMSELITKRYSAVLGTETPHYVDKDSSLYGLIKPMGSGFPYEEESITISSVKASSFTAKASYNDFGATSTITLEIVNDNGTWKIKSFDANR